MAFETKESIVGTTQILKRDIKIGAGTFTKGTEVIVTGEGDRGYEIKDPVSGHSAIECGYDIFKGN